VHWALVINALSFVVSFVCVRLVAAPPSARSVGVGQQGHVLHEFFAGLRFAFSNRIISTVLGVSFLVTLGTGAFDALIAFFVVQNLHTPVANLGYLAGVFGGGAIVGALAGALLLRRVNPARLLVLSLLVGGVVFALFARSTTLLMGVALTLLVGILFSVVNMPISPLVIGATPRELLGRVGAVITPVVSAAQLVSVALAGYLASAVVAGLHTQVVGIPVGPIDTIFTGTALLILLAGVFAAARLWTYTSPTSPETGTA
jgi:Na+/melibiose symporter-like transporter